MKTMKYVFVAAVLTTALSVGCNDHKKELEESQQREKAEKVSKDSIQEVFVQTLWEIDRNLQVIQEKEGSIQAPGTAEQGVTPKEHIMRNIQVINTLMDENKKKIADLEVQVKKYKISNAGIVKLMKDAQAKVKLQEENIASLKEQLAQRENELALRQQDISNLQAKMSESEMKNQMLEELSTRYQKDANTAYYTVGTTRELKEEGVIKTGLLGKKVSTAAPEAKFTRIDIREVDCIPVNAKKVKLLTAHPASSYTVKKEGDEIVCLQITNPSDFWKMSKYAVLEKR